MKQRSIKLRMAAFNMENLDDKLGKRPTLPERIAVMRPQPIRFNADILCLQEVNGRRSRQSSSSASARVAPGWYAIWGIPKGLHNEQGR